MSTPKVPNAAGWWWLDERPTSITTWRTEESDDRNGQLCYVTIYGRVSFVADTVPSRWGGPCLRSPAPTCEIGQALAPIALATTAPAQDGAREAQGMTARQIAYMRAELAEFPELDVPAGRLIACLDEVERLQANIGLLRDTIAAQKEINNALRESRDKLQAELAKANERIAELESEAKQPEAKAGPWVKCAGRMPDREVVVLCAFRDGRTQRCCVSGVGKWFDVEDGCYRDLEEITHWMTIPPLEATSQPTLDDSKAAALREIKAQYLKPNTSDNALLNAIEAICDRALGSDNLKT